MSQNKGLVEESSKTKKTREKLRKYLAEMDQGITPQALKRKSLEIHRWIARHASDRIVLRSKSFSLFDENQNTAKLSQKAALVVEKLKKISKVKGVLK